MTRYFAAMSALVLALLLGGTALWILTRPADRYADCRGGQVAGGDIGGPFTLVDQTGRSVTEADVLKGPSLVYFGYTFCPDVCPLDNARNAEAVDLLEKKGFKVTPVFITIDPARDTPEVMAKFTEAIHPAMIGLTGTQDQVTAAERAYKVYAKKQASEDEYYLMDHSTFTYLMLPGTGFADFFSRETTGAEMADRVGCFLSKG